MMRPQRQRTLSLGAPEIVVARVLHDEPDVILACELYARGHGASVRDVDGVRSHVAQRARADGVKDRFVDERTTRVVVPVGRYDTDGLIDAMLYKRQCCTIKGDTGREDSSTHKGSTKFQSSASIEHAALLGCEP
ncbi:hypothetical protein NPX13_g5394 [Xylaria arbuscula]|uniref:Uncharacterized protein n=1 Tax=Xylaria arbuscula TaxID=114810 RepID=A0A9W8NE30_9PEZI|nr:hypothetical protein NPX13_g5394 [Xylaria arbuscula]